MRSPPNHHRYTYLKSLFSIFAVSAVLKISFWSYYAAYGLSRYHVFRIKPSFIAAETHILFTPQRHCIVRMFALLSTCSMTDLCFQTTMAGSLSLGCAQDTNSNLLSPSKIQWFNDVDNEHPIPAALPTSLCSSESSPPQPTTLDHFFSSGSGNTTPKAAEKPGIAPSRRSGGATRLSARILDPDNTETSAISSSLKRKASTGRVTEKVSRARKVIEDSDGGGDTKLDDTQDTQDEGDNDNALDNSFVDPMENADSGEDSDTEGNYISTKALGDADREVSSSLIYSWRVLNLLCVHIAQPSTKK